MRNVLAIAACFAALTTSAMATTTRAYCKTEAGLRVDIIGSDGKVATKWEGNDFKWRVVETSVERTKNNKKALTLVDKTPNGVVVIAWDFESEAAAVVMRNDVTGETMSSRARCYGIDKD